MSPTLLAVRMRSVWSAALARHESLKCVNDRDEKASTGLGVCLRSRPGVGAECGLERRERNRARSRRLGPHLARTPGRDRSRARTGVSTPDVRVPGLAEVASVHQEHARRLRVPALLLADCGVSESARLAPAGPLRSRASPHGVPLLDAELSAAARHPVRLGPGRRRGIGAEAVLAWTWGSRRAA